MRLIRKGPEPASLAEYRKEPGASFRDCTCKDDIRDALLQEQGHLCAYCMRPIQWVRNGPGVTGEEIRRRDMKIEHWYPERLLDDAGTLDYQNMLGVCKGRHEGEAEDTCDTKKSGALITVDPRKQEHIDRIRYDIVDEEILIHSDDPDIDEDLKKRLNLNANQLPGARFAVYDEFIRKLQYLKEQGMFSAETLKKIRDYYEKPGTDGRLPAYSGLILWYFDSKNAEVVCVKFSLASKQIN